MCPSRPPTPKLMQGWVVSPNVTRERDPTEVAAQMRLLGCLVLPTDGLIEAKDLDRQRKHQRSMLTEKGNGNTQGGGTVHQPR